MNVAFAFCFARAKKERDENLATCFNFEDFCNNVDKKKLILAPFCGGIPCEEKIKKLSARYVFTAYVTVLDTFPAFYTDKEKH
jgi:Prolyl-tRNA synthetase, C-terminal